MRTIEVCYDKHTYKRIVLAVAAVRLYTIQAYILVAGFSYFLFNVLNKQIDNI